MNMRDLMLRAVAILNCLLIVGFFVGVAIGSPMFGIVIVVVGWLCLGGALWVVAKLWQCRASRRAARVDLPGARVL